MNVSVFVTVTLHWDSQTRKKRKMTAIWMTVGIQRPVCTATVLSKRKTGRKMIDVEDVFQVYVSVITEFIINMRKTSDCHYCTVYTHQKDKSTG